MQLEVTKFTQLITTAVLLREDIPAHVIINQANTYLIIIFSFPAHAAKNIWKKKFFEEKRKTAALEEQVNRLRHEVDAQHKTLMAYLESKGMLFRLKMIAV